jgi:hypothetical protein
MIVDPMRQLQRSLYRTVEILKERGHVAECRDDASPVTGLSVDDLGTGMKRPEQT